MSQDTPPRLTLFKKYDLHHALGPTVLSKPGEDSIPHSKKWVEQLRKARKHSLIADVIYNGFFTGMATLSLGTFIVFLRIFTHHPEDGVALSMWLLSAVLFIIGVICLGISILEANEAKRILKDGRSGFLLRFMNACDAWNLRVPSLNSKLKLVEQCRVKYEDIQEEIESAREVNKKLNNDLWYAQWQIQEHGPLGECISSVPLDPPKLLSKNIDDKDLLGALSVPDPNTIPLSEANPS